MKRHIIVPGFLFIYALVMAYIGWEQWVEVEGRTLEYVLFNVAELVIIIILYFLLQRKEKLRNKRKL